jgi:hypothetical protein
VTTDPIKPKAPIFSPTKLVRIGSMIRQILEEMHDSVLDEESVVSLRTVYSNTVTELERNLPPELIEELGHLILPFEEDAELTDIELKMALAQLIGWMEGLIGGLQLLFRAHQNQETSLTETEPGGESGQYL